MKSSQAASVAVLAAAILSAGSAFAAAPASLSVAGEVAVATPVTPSAFTREQGRAAAREAVRNHSADVKGETALPTPVTPSSVTRDEVRAEYQRARAAGSLQRFEG